MPHGFTVRPFDVNDGYIGEGDGVNPRPQCTDTYDVRAGCVEKYSKSFDSCLYEGEDPNRTYNGSQGVGYANSYKNFGLQKNLEDLWATLTSDEKEAARCIGIEVMDKKPLTHCSTHRHPLFLSPPCSPAYRQIRPPRGGNFDCENAARKKCMDCCIQENGANPADGNDWCGSGTPSVGSGSTKSSVGLSGFLSGSNNKQEPVDILSPTKVNYPYPNLTTNFYIVGNQYDYTLDLDAVRQAAVQTYLTGGDNSGGYFGGNPSLQQQCTARCDTLFNLAVTNAARKIDQMLSSMYRGYLQHYSRCFDKYSNIITGCVKSSENRPIGRPPVDTRPPIPGDSRIGGPLPSGRIEGQRL